MKPRQPYRSPFWTPASADASQRTARAEPMPPVELARTGRHATPAAAVQRRAEPAAQDRSVSYAPADLALFGKLMAFGNRAEFAELTPAPQPPHRAPAAPTIPADSTRGGSSPAYHDRDARLFESLEAAFAGTGQPAATARPAVAGGPPEPPPRRYAPADLAAFDRLAKFGRSA